MVKLLEISSDVVEEGASLQVLRPSRGAVIVIPFTDETFDVDVHYEPTPEIRTYVPCNGDTCALCQLGRRKEKRHLLPVYEGESDSVAILAMSDSGRPGALLPQLSAALQKYASSRFVMQIEQEGYRFTVASSELPPDVETGGEVIRIFIENLEAGVVKLKNVYPTISNEQLLQYDSIANGVKLRRNLSL